MWRPARGAASQGAATVWERSCRDSFLSHSWTRVLWGSSVSGWARVWDSRSQDGFLRNEEEEQEEEAPAAPPPPAAPTWARRVKHNGWSERTRGAFRPRFQDKRQLAEERETLGGAAGTQSSRTRSRRFWTLGSSTKRSRGTTTDSARSSHNSAATTFTNTSPSVQQPPTSSSSVPAGDPPDS